MNERTNELTGDFLTGAAKVDATDRDKRDNLEVL